MSRTFFTIAYDSTSRNIHCPSCNCHELCSICFFVECFLLEHLGIVLRELFVVVITFIKNFS